MTVAAQEFDLQGHRGARGLAPENTLEAFARALSIGVTTLEMDLGVTRDGVVVVTHNLRLDPHTTRDGNGDWLRAPGPAVRALDLAQIKSFDVGRIKPGTRYAKRFPDQRPVDGARIPTLNEVIRLVQRSGNERVRLDLETKLDPTTPELSPTPGDFVAAAMAVIRDRGFADRVILQSFDWRTLQEIQRQAPDVPTSYLTAQQDWLDNIRSGEAGPSPWTAGLDVDDVVGSVPRLVAAAGGDIWSPYHRGVSAADVKEAHDLGLKVSVWTVNDPGRMEALLDMGVDGIITDYPDRLRHVLVARGREVPPPTPVTPRGEPSD